MIALSGVINISCTSMVYSPSINLPDKIQKNDTRITGAYEGLASVAHFIDNGIIISIQHSFSDSVSLQLKYWSDIDTYHNQKKYLHGASLTTYILIGDSNSTYKSYFAPTFGMAFNKDALQMWTIGGWYAVQTPPLYFLKPYGAIGLIFGSEDYKRDSHVGFGLVLNLGSNIKIYRNLKFNIELTGSMVIAEGAELPGFFFSPTFGFSYGL